MKSSNQTSKLVVVLVDMQEFFLQRIDPDTRKEIVANQIQILKFCASHKIPLVVLEYEGTNRGKTIPVLQTEIKKISQVVVIRKPHNSGFRDTELDETLRAAATVYRSIPYGEASTHSSSTQGIYCDRFFRNRFSGLGTFSASPNPTDYNQEAHAQIYKREWR